jgi:hypothetical protein
MEYGESQPSDVDTKHWTKTPTYLRIFGDASS